jgi:DNA-binding NarL/FixJ family response regulator
MQYQDGLAMTPTKILVIDDDADFRQLLITLLQADPRVRVSGQAGDGEAALDLVRRESPGIVLMDLMMPRVDGLEATRRIKRVAPETKVVVLSSVADERYRRLAFDSGADVFLNKRDTVIALVPTIRNLVAGVAEGQ